MLRTHQRLLHRGVQSLDILIVGVAVWLGALVLATPAAEIAIVLQQAAIICMSWVLVSLRTNFYQSRRTESLAQEFFEFLETWLVTLALGSLLIYALWNGLTFDVISTFVAALLGIGGLRLSIRLGLRRLRDQGKNLRKVVIVGRGRMSHKIEETVRDKSYYGLRVAGSFYLRNEMGPPPDDVTCLGDAARFAKAITEMEIDAVILCPDLRVSSSDIQYILDKCDVAGIQCLYAPDFLHLNNLTVTSTSFSGMPAFTFQPSLGSPAHLAIKRGMDIVGATIGITLCLPVLVAVSLAVKLQDRGPLLFRQIRMGKDGRRFYCYKFRSMCVDAEARKHEVAQFNEQDGPVFKIKEDPRITRVGRLIRRYSLDELPQLFNVLLGDMSLVGPRPPVPSEVARYSWWQRRRISVRPGLTCLWQVKGRNKVSFEKWMEMDLFYIDNWSLWMDIKLMMQTMPAVVRGTGS
jgi:exopolysaccharide biosynthesis polyprenyl glycosylphosphotransferase